MIGKFIYVFSDDARNYLVNMGYRLLTEDSARQIYVFLNKDNQNFSSTDIQFAMSDVLTF